MSGASTDSEAIGALRSRLRLGSLPVVLYTGNLEGYQGVDLLIGAAARVEGASFLIVGGRADEIVALQAVPGPPVSPRVFAGAQPPSELPLYLGLADILVSPRIEGTNTPFKLYTYMASGKPVVATRIESHTQVLGDDTAFLADPTAESLANAIREAVLHPAVAAARAASARALASREYSAERYLEKVRGAYDEIGRLVAAR